MKPPILSRNPRHTIEMARRLADDLERLLLNGAPTTSDLSGAPTLDFWDRTQAPSPALIGVISGHPLIRDGRISVTSNLFALDGDGAWARTWSRWYRLREKAPPLQSDNKKPSGWPQ